MTHAVIYLRQSKDRDKDDAEEAEKAVRRQLDACKRLAFERGWTLLAREPYKDNDKSASNGKERPEYEAMLQAADRYEFDVIQQGPVARLSRTPAELRWAGRELGADTEEVLDV